VGIFQRDDANCMKTRTDAAQCSQIGARRERIAVGRPIRPRKELSGWVWKSMPPFRKEEQVVALLGLGVDAAGVEQIGPRLFAGFRQEFVRLGTTFDGARLDTVGPIANPLPSDQPPLGLGQGA